MLSSCCATSTGLMVEPGVANVRAEGCTGVEPGVVP